MGLPASLVLFLVLWTPRRCPQVQGQRPAAPTAPPRLAPRVRYRVAVVRLCPDLQAAGTSRLVECLCSPGALGHPRWSMLTVGFGVGALGPEWLDTEGQCLIEGHGYESLSPRIWGTGVWVSFPGRQNSVCVATCGCREEVAPSTAALGGDKLGPAWEPRPLAAVKLCLFAVVSPSREHNRFQGVLGVLPVNCQN